jgi:hypothetical protein
MINLFASSNHMFKSEQISKVSKQFSVIRSLQHALFPVTLADARQRQSYHRYKATFPVTAVQIG